MWSNSEILSSQTFVKCWQTLSFDDFSDTIQITAIHSLLKNIVVRTKSQHLHIELPELVGCKAW